MKINAKIYIGLFITLVYFLIHLLIINDYGISWDFHYHLFGGLYHLGQKVPSINDPYPIPFTPPDPRLATNDPFGPFTQIIPAASYLIFYKNLHLLPFDSAYNLPSVIFGSLGVLVLFLFLYESINFPVALFFSIFLALLPTHFGYLHNNMKDVPNAFAFSLSIYMFWRLVKYQRLKDLFIAVLSFAFAFNIKINSVMVPAVCLVWFLFKERKAIITVIPTKRSPSTVRYGTSAWRDLLRMRVSLSDKLRDSSTALGMTVKKYKLIILYFVLTPLAALLVWWPFWRDPIGKILELPFYFTHNTLNMPVLFLGKIYRSGINIPWDYPWIYILFTTPIGILVSFLTGLAISLSKLLNKNPVYGLLLFWLIVPLIRYLILNVAAIDGMRHFMEIIYPLSALAGIGFYFICKQLEIVIQKLKAILFFERKREVFQRESSRLEVSNNKKLPISSITLFAIVILTLVYNLYKFHPYQTSFYNALTGGVKGADGKFDIDFWGTPQREAMLWLNKNAPNGSFIHVVMAQSSAAMYARVDLQDKINKKDWQNSDYTVILNKRSFFTIYPVEKYLSKSLNENKLVYKKTIEGVPLFWVIKN